MSNSRVRQDPSILLSPPESSPISASAADRDREPSAADDKIHDDDSRQLRHIWFVSIASRYFFAKPVLLPALAILVAFAGGTLAVSIGKPSPGPLGGPTWAFVFAAALCINAHALMAIGSCWRTLVKWTRVVQAVADFRGGTGALNIDLSKDLPVPSSFPSLSVWAAVLHVLVVVGCLAYTVETTYFATLSVPWGWAVGDGTTWTNSLWICASVTLFAFFVVPFVFSVIFLVSMFESSLLLLLRCAIPGDLALALPEAHVDRLARRMARETAGQYDLHLGRQAALSCALTAVNVAAGGDVWNGHPGARTFMHPDALELLIRTAGRQLAASVARFAEVPIVTIVTCGAVVFFSQLISILYAHGNVVASYYVNLVVGTVAMLLFPCWYSLQVNRRWDALRNALSRSHVTVFLSTAVMQKECSDAVVAEARAIAAFLATCDVGSAGDSAMAPPVGVAVRIRSDAGAEPSAADANAASSLRPYAAPVWDAASECREAFLRVFDNAELQSQTQLWIGISALGVTFIPTRDLFMKLVVGNVIAALLPVAQQVLSPPSSSESDPD